MFYLHEGRTQKLCAGTWFYSQHLEPEDLPSVERLIEIHVENLR